jgi:FdhD protein
MRTPGQDRELAAGFLLTENLVRSATDIFDVTQCGVGGRTVVNVTLKNPAAFDPAKLTRNVFSSSSCGVCSKATIAAVRQRFPIESTAVAPRRPPAAGALRERQETFEQPAAACLRVVRSRRDSQPCVKTSAAQRARQADRSRAARVLCRCATACCCSAAVSFEMMQKALAAGIPIVAAISAPTTLAVEFARESHQTLIGSSEARR